MKDIAEQLGIVLMKKPISAKCDKCKTRPRYREQDKTRKWCKRCIDRYRREQNQTPEKMEAKIFDIVEPLYVDACLDDLGKALTKQVLNRPEDQDVFLFGAPGVGKTHTMAAFVRHYIGIGHKCIRINFDDFCCQIRSTMSPASKQTEWDLVEPLKDVDVLFIDDLGLRSKRETDFAYITLYSILNKRQERLLPTFISTNKDLDRLRESFDERIVSRLQTALQIKVVGKDRRKSE